MLIVLLATALAAATFGLRLIVPAAIHRPLETPAEQIAAMRSFDAEAYVRAAIAKGDFRHVKVSDMWNGAKTPGIVCIASLADGRQVFFSDVISEGDDELRPLLTEAARRFNRALIADPAYPHKDVCFLADKQMNIAEAIEIARQPDRKPQIIDLHTAVRAQDDTAITKRLSTGANVNAEDAWRQTPLMWAARRKNRSQIAQLIAAGGDISHFELDAPLLAAVDTGDADVTRDILVAGTVPTPAHSTPKGWRDYTNMHLVTAIALGRPDLLELLLSFEAAPARDAGSAWNVPISLAIKRKCGACLDAILRFGGPALVDSGALDSIVDEELETEQSPFLVQLVGGATGRLAFSEVSDRALRAALESNQPRLLRSLLTSGQDVNLLTPPEAAELIAVATHGGEKEMATLLTVAAKRRSALNAAIAASDLQAIRAAVPRGATLAQRNTMTPLMVAASTARPETLAALIDLGATVDAQVRRGEFSSNAAGYSALYFAVEGVNIEGARLLLRRGADPDQRAGAWPLASDVPRVLEKATSEQRIALIDLFLTAPPAIRRTDRADLMLASAAGWSYFTGEEMVDLLLARGANSCATVAYYRGAIPAAATGKSFELFKRLVDRCPNWSPTSQVARDALKEALDNPYFGDDEKPRMAIIRFLLGQKTPLPNGEFASQKLCDAARTGNIELMELLLNAGAALNRVVYDRTPLDCAAGLLRPKNAAAQAWLRKRGARTATELGHKSQTWPFPF